MYKPQTCQFCQNGGLMRSAVMSEHTQTGQLRAPLCRLHVHYRKIQCRFPPADDLLPWLLRLPDAVPLSSDSRSHEGVPNGLGIFARSSSAAASSAARSAIGQLSAAAGAAGGSAAAGGSVAITASHSAACSPTDRHHAEPNRLCAAGANCVHDGKFHSLSMHMMPLLLSHRAHYGAELPTVRASVSSRWPARQRRMEARRRCACCLACALYACKTPWDGCLRWKGNSCDNVSGHMTVGPGNAQ